MHGVDVTVTGTGRHARIHPALPGSGNNGYLVAGVVLHPGDAFDVPQASVDVLLVPFGGPWLKVVGQVLITRERCGSRGIHVILTPKGLPRSKKPCPATPRRS